MLGSSIVYDVSRDLNDQVEGYSYIRWTSDQLASYLREAVVQLASSNRQFFTCTYVVHITPGAGWQTACDCTHIKRVVGECTADGQLIRRLVEKSDGNEYIWPGDETCVTYGSDIYAYSINSIKDSEFMVYPPVSPKQDKYVMIECYGIPDVSDPLTFDVPERFVQAVKQWMLYRALIIDAENNTAIANIANTHVQVYQRLVSELIAETKELEVEANGRNRDVRTVQDGSSGKVPSGA